ncbi:MAG: chorismate synthase, partial [Clostridia bacterium]|nr:chorismate synthase [Clostridia bacterium]
MSFFGKTIQTDIFGESHAPKIGVTVTGLPAGAHIDLDALQAFCDLRAPGQNAWSTPRREADRVIVLSGLSPDGILDGTPFRAIIQNTNTRSGDYETAIPRPGHADFPAFVKHGRIPAGGGAYSGRMTAPLCIAGGVALQLLARKGVHADAHILSVHSVRDNAFDETDETPSETYKKTFPVLNKAAGEAMKRAILAAR